MKKLGFVAASLVTLMAATGAQAADPIFIDDVAIDMASPSGWDGLYVGAGVIFESSTTIVETLIGAQGVIGVNQTFGGNFLLGAELYAMGYNSSLTGVGGAIGAEARAGILASDTVLLYGALGAEVNSTANTYGTIGGGIEFKATDDLSIDLEYKYYVGLNNGWRGHHVGISANWHF